MAGAVHVNERTRGTWRMVCDRGWITFAAVLAPSGPRLQALLWEDELPPSALLVRSAESAASFITAWNAAAAAKLLAPTVDAQATRKALAYVGLDHGACKLGEPVAGDGATSARFRLSCTSGVVELSVTVDPATERVTRLRTAPPRTSAYCTP
jgi:hypothetical protein